MDKVLFSSAKEDWETPLDFYKKLDEEFHFDLDPCADSSNHKCKKFYTKEENGLVQDWGGHTVFCNPPYGRKSTGEWIKKCAEEAKKPGTIVVMLIPVRTDTRAFHEYIYKKAEIRFVKGRLKFGGSSDSAEYMRTGILNNLTYDLMTAEEVKNKRRCCGAKTFKKKKTKRKMAKLSRRKN